MSFRNCSRLIRSRSQRAFTLVEIMVVVIVLGVLAAIVLPNLAGKTDQAMVSKARSDISTFASLIEAFRMDMHRYPTEDEGLNVLREPPQGDDADLWKGPYSRKPIPKDPWGEAYVYYAPAPNGIDEYGIESLGSDKAPGGEKFAQDINSWSNYGEEEQQ